jgi:uncharacterized protein
VIAMNSASGFVGYLGTVHIDWIFLGGFTASSIAGALGGTALASRVPQAALKRGFAVFLIAIGGLVLYRSRDVFHVTPRSSSTTSTASSAANTIAR